MIDRGLTAAVVTAGMVTLAAEFTASRLIQTVYGASNLVWANVIGLVLLSLAVGNALGGQLADRRPTRQRFYRLNLAAGAATIASLLLAAALLRRATTLLAAAEVGALLGSLLAVGLMLVVPVLLLGCITPFAVRLAIVDVSRAGRVSGRLYAASTAGSLLGVYLPVLVTIPLAGARLTALIFGGLQLLVGAIGLWHVRRRPPVEGAAALALVAPLAAWALAGTGPPAAGVLVEVESAYNVIRVVEQDGCRLLQLNEGFGVHAVHCPGRPLPPHTVWPLLAAAPLLVDGYGAPAAVGPGAEAPRIAIVGFATGTVAGLQRAIFPDAAIDGIEIDPAIVAIGRDYFDLPPANVHIGDGRAQLARLAGPYDAIIVDAYRVPYIPWHLVTREFFALARERLAPGGVLVLNAGRAPGERALVEALTATLLTEFESVVTIDAPDSLNTVLVAADGTSADGTSADPRSADADLPANSPPWLADTLALARRHRVPTVAGPGIFTDDRAPVEPMIDALALRTLWRAAGSR